MGGPQYSVLSVLSQPKSRYFDLSIFVALHCAYRYFPTVCVRGWTGGGEGWGGRLAKIFFCLRNGNFVLATPMPLRGLDCKDFPHRGIREKPSLPPNAWRI